MNRIDFRNQISSNKRASFFLVVLVFLVLITLGYVIALISGPDYFFLILIISIIISITYILISYFNSSKIAIASVRAKKATTSLYPDYHRLVESLTVASGLPKPELYIMDSPQINAFASGRNPKSAVVCVTTGALEKLDRRELEGVLAHELSHIANYDMLYMTLVSVMIGLIAIISEVFLRSLWFRGSRNRNNSNAILIVAGILLAILAPILVRLVQFAISRKREYSADATAVKFTRNPQGLIGALSKIKNDSILETKTSKALAPLFFANPFSKLTSTHPPLDKRIETLKRM